MTNITEIVHPTKAHWKLSNFLSSLDVLQDCCMMFLPSFLPSKSETSEQPLDVLLFDFFFPLQILNWQPGNEAGMNTTALVDGLESEALTVQFTQYAN